MNIGELDLVDEYDIMTFEGVQIHIIGTIHKQNNYKPTKRPVTDFLVDRANNQELVLIEYPVGQEAIINDYAINAIRNNVIPQRKQFVIDSDYRLSFVSGHDFKNFIYYEPSLFNPPMDMKRIEIIRKVVNKESVLKCLKKLIDFVKEWKNNKQIWDYWKKRLPNYMTWLDAFQTAAVQLGNMIKNDNGDFLLRKDLTNVMQYVREFLVITSDFLMIKNILMMKDDMLRRGGKVENIWIIFGMFHTRYIKMLMRQDILIDIRTKKSVPNPNYKKI